MIDIERLCDRRHLRLLLGIAEVGSFSAAAVELGVSQSSISQQVKRLEKLAGRKLFRRARSGVVLTPDGEAVVIYARAMLALTDDLRREFDQAPDVMPVGVAMSEDFCRTALPTLLHFFSQQHPSIELRVISGSYDVVSAALEAGTVQLAVIRRYSRFPNAHLLWTDELRWFGRSNPSRFPLADPIDLVLPVAPNPAREAAFDALRAAGRTWRIRFESPGLAGIEAALQAGLGFCAAPRSMLFHNVSPLGDESGLPPLPGVDFVMVGPAPASSDAVLAFAELLRSMALSGFQ